MLDANDFQNVLVKPWWCFYRSAVESILSLFENGVWWRGGTLIWPCKGMCT